MKKKVIVGIVALLLIGAVIGGLVWYKKKGNAHVKRSGDGSLTDASGNVIEITKSLFNSTYGYHTLVNGVQNGHLVSMELKADGLVYGTNGEGKVFVWKGYWHPLS